MDQTTVVNEIKHAGQQILTALDTAGFTVTAAGWVQTGDDGRPYLYLVTPHVDTGATRDAYTRVGGVVRSLPNSPVGLADIKLIPTFDPLAEAMSRYSDRHAASPMNSHIFTDNFLGVSVQRPVFLYAPLTPASTPAG